MIHFIEAKEDNIRCTCYVLLPK